MRRPWLLLVLLYAVLCSVVTTWVLLDRRPPEWDHANHLERAVGCSHSLRIVAAAGTREILEASSFYPPLVTCTAGLLYLVFSLTNFQLDLPLASMVALALYALVRSDAFEDLPWTLGLGAVWGLGMLTKPPFALYVLPPLLWSFWRALRAGDRGRRLAGAATALALGAVIAVPWYGPRLFGLPMQILNRSFKQAAEQQNPEPLTSVALLYYPRTLPTQIGLLSGALLLWGLWALRKRREARATLWLATLGPFLLFSLIQNKNLRYTLPILPAAALVAAVGLRSLPGALRRWTSVAVVALAALQVSMTLFQVP